MPSKPAEKFKSCANPEIVKILKQLRYKILIQGKIKCAISSFKRNRASTKACNHLRKRKNTGTILKYDFLIPPQSSVNKAMNEFESSEHLPMS